MAREVLTTFEKIKLYAYEPRCLGCGYALRGLRGQAEFACCPECGRACRDADLVDQIGRLTHQQDPTYGVIKSGIHTLLSGVLAAAFVGLLFRGCLAGGYRGFAGWYIFALVFFYCAWRWGVTGYNAWRACDGPRGLKLWVTAQGLAVVFWVSAVAGLMAAGDVFRGLRTSSIYPAGWQGGGVVVVLCLAGACMVAAWFGLRRGVLGACRRHTQSIAKTMLDRSASGP